MNQPDTDAARAQPAPRSMPPTCAKGRPAPRPLLESAFVSRHGCLLSAYVFTQSRTQRTKVYARAPFPRTIVAGCHAASATARVIRQTVTHVRNLPSYLQPVSDNKPRPVSRRSSKNAREMFDLVCCQPSYARHLDCQNHIALRRIQFVSHQQNNIVAQDFNDAKQGSPAKPNTIAFAGVKYRSFSVLCASAPEQHSHAPPSLIIWAAFAIAPLAVNGPCQITDHACGAKQRCVAHSPANRNSTTALRPTNRPAPDASPTRRRVRPAIAGRYNTIRSVQSSTWQRAAAAICFAPFLRRNAAKTGICGCLLYPFRNLIARRHRSQDTTRPSLPSKWEKISAEAKSFLPPTIRY